MGSATFCVVSAQTDKAYYMTEDQIQAAYDYQQWQNCYEDVKRHIEDWLNEFDVDKKSFKKRFGVDYDTLYNCADAITDDFLENYDADIAENDQFDSLIQEYINKLKEFGESGI